MLVLKVKTLDGGTELDLTGETVTEILGKLIANAEFFVVGQTYRRIRFDVVSEAVSA
jgi:hypothetical protein